MSFECEFEGWILHKFEGQFKSQFERRFYINLKVNSMHAPGRSPGFCLV